MEILKIHTNLKDFKETAIIHKGFLLIDCRLFNVLDINEINEFFSSDYFRYTKKDEIAKIHNSLIESLDDKRTFIGCINNMFFENNSLDGFDVLKINGIHKLIDVLPLDEALITIKAMCCVTNNERTDYVNTIHRLLDLKKPIYYDLVSQYRIDYNNLWKIQQSLFESNDIDVIKRYVDNNENMSQVYIYLKNFNIEDKNMFYEVYHLLWDKYRKIEQIKSEKNQRNHIEYVISLIEDLKQYSKIKSLIYKFIKRK